MKSPIKVLTKPLRPLRSGRDYQSRLYREQSPLKMLAIPIVTVVLASAITAMPVITDQALLPPLGYMVFLAWRLLRPGLLPMWAGLPFGLVDDILSGQPFGSAGLLWSLSMLIIELIDARGAWRDYWQDWFIAGVLIIAYLLGGLWIVGLAHTRPDIVSLFPQIVISILTYPLVVRIVSMLDRWRLAT
jgi:rod shape-determining protein MreD